MPTFQSVVVENEKDAPDTSLIATSIQADTYGNTIMALENETAFIYFFLGLCCVMCICVPCIPLYFCLKGILSTNTKILFNDQTRQVIVSHVGTFFSSLGSYVYTIAYEEVLDVELCLDTMRLNDQDCAHLCLKMRSNGKRVHISSTEQLAIAKQRATFVKHLLMQKWRDNL